MPRDRIGATTRGWQRLTTALFANAADLLHLAERRERLAVLLDRIEELGNQQATPAASKQEVREDRREAGRVRDPSLPRPAP